MIGYLIVGFTILIEVLNARYSLIWKLILKLAILAIDLAGAAYRVRGGGMLHNGLPDAQPHCITAPKYNCIPSSSSGHGKLGSYLDCA